jgi:hypothetical protein
MLRSTLLLVTSLFAAVVLGQAEAKTAMTAALSSGNTGAITEQLMPNVDLTVPGSSDLVSKAQATGILKKFFDEHPAQGFTVDHEGNSKLGDHYCIGTLRTGKGAFRVTFLLKKAGDRFQVKQLRIEPSNP